MRYCSQQPVAQAVAAGFVRLTEHDAGDLDVAGRGATGLELQVTQLDLVETQLAREQRPPRERAVDLFQPQTLAAFAVEQAQIAQPQTRAQTVPFAGDVSDIDALIGGAGQRLNDERAVLVDIGENPVAQHQNQHEERDGTGQDRERDQSVEPHGTVFEPASSAKRTGI